jgi:hypothetical protein
LRGDLEAAVVMLAADNARLCDIALAADKLLEAAEIALRIGVPAGLDGAVEKFKQVRNGQ